MATWIDSCLVESCKKPTVAMAYVEGAPGESRPFAVCKEHSRGHLLMPLSEVVKLAMEASMALLRSADRAAVSDGDVSMSESLRQDVSDGEGATSEARTSTRVIARAASEGHCTSHVEFTSSCLWCGIARDSLARATASPVVAPSATDEGGA